MKVEQYKCDVCGTLKGEPNHWFIIRLGGAFHIYPWDFYGGEDEDTSIEREQHVCGNACAQKRLEEWMAK